MKRIIIGFCALLFIGLAILSGLLLYEYLTITLFVYFFLMFLQDLGNKIVVLDLTILMAFLTCLIMPIVFYHFYTQANPIAMLWRKYMPIPEDAYLSFALPAVVVLALGLKLPLRKLKMNKTPGMYLENVKRYLIQRPTMGIYLVGAGVISGLLNFLAGEALREVFFLAAHLVFVGVFYVIYSPNKHKRLVVPGVLVLMIGESILTGMFGELVFILALSIILVLLGKQISYRRKLGFAILGLVFILIIQSVKGDYRRKSWKGGGADPVYFAQLITEKVVSPSSMFDPKDLFVISVRMNQGWLVAETMKMVPQVHPFGNGEPLAGAVAAAIVPRFIWPNKPEAGGKENLKRFWGFTLVGWSTNIGILGEAYANFDRAGGWAYVFFYGVFFNLILSGILKMSEKRPTLILWLPFLFFSVINVETDLLTTMGALVKSIMFMYIIYLLFHYAFRTDL